MKWHDTAFGGNFGGHSWQRLAAEVEVIRNGSFIDFYIRFPGDEESRKFLITTADLEAAIAKKHGEATTIRIECDTPMDQALREVHPA